MGKAGEKTLLLLPPGDIKRKKGEHVPSFPPAPATIATLFPDEEAALFTLRSEALDGLFRIDFVAVDLVEPMELAFCTVFTPVADSASVAIVCCCLSLLLVLPLLLEGLLLLL